MVVEGLQGSGNIHSFDVCCLQLFHNCSTVHLWVHAEQCKISGTLELEGGCDELLALVEEVSIRTAQFHHSPDTQSQLAI